VRHFLSATIICRLGIVVLALVVVLGRQLFALVPLVNQLETLLVRPYRLEAALPLVFHRMQQALLVVVAVPFVKLLFVRLVLLLSG
jgi:hypothetical protein